MSGDSQSPANLIALHQCLFGYDDGHRLLASSAKLTGEAHSLLLLLSDLVPGIKLNEVDSYWTGIPLRDQKQYALMRTWPAPEMSRPGCVWTHVILVGFTDVARFWDLGALRNLTVRPVVPNGYDSYRKIITLDPAEISQPINLFSQRAINSYHALRLIRVVYGGQFNPDIDAKAGEFDEALFALWSQQWPRLRRFFAFRTAASKLEGTYPSARFDLRLVINSDNLPTVLHDPKPWEATAMDDICNIKQTDFRRFLWRYGSDLHNGFNRFKFLADIYLGTRCNILEGSHLAVIFDEIVRKIPDPLDGLTLKGDLVACGQQKFSLLPPADEIDTFAFFIHHPEIDALPRPSIDACDAVKKYWHSKQNAILMLAIQATVQQSEIGEIIINTLAFLIEPTEFLEVTKDQFILRERLMTLNPTLLISEKLTEIPLPELLWLLDLPQVDYSGIVEQLLTYLMRQDDIVIAEEMWRRFPNETLKSSIEILRKSVEENGLRLPFAWHHELGKNRSSLLNGSIIETAQSTRFLATLSDILGYDSNDVLMLGPRPWITALQAAKDDIFGEERQTFLSFLLTLVIRYPESGSELILELAFEVVHNDIWNSRLSRKGFSILSRHLPDIGWFANWDNCKRLRIAVVSAYIKGNLNPMSFHRLTNNSSLLKQLTDSAKETKKGRYFLKTIPD